MNQKTSHPEIPLAFYVIQDPEYVEAPDSESLIER
jgi:hypothetical protein